MPKGEGQLGIESAVKEVAGKYGHMPKSEELPVTWSNDLLPYQSRLDKRQRIRLLLALPARYSHSKVETVRELRDDLVQKASLSGCSQKPL